jgi:hypothetical protein
MGVVELDLYDRSVECTDAGCVDGDGEPVEPVVVRSWAFMSTQTTRFEPAGRYLLFQVNHPGGAIGTVELDISEEVLGEADVAYVERVGEEVTFEARDAAGSIELPVDALGDDCTCTDARFDLVFTSAGADGELGTADDETRRLTRARASLDDGFCVTPTITPEPGPLDVRIVDRCPPRYAPPSPARPADEDPYDASASAGCATDSSTSTGDSAGCDCEGDSSGCADGGGSSGSSSSGCDCEGDSSSSGSGCEGDGSSSGSGCEGDGSSSGSGCEGDGSSSDCEGGARDDYDRHAAASTTRRCRLRRATVLGGQLQTPLFVGLVLFYLRTRARR